MLGRCRGRLARNITNRITGTGRRLMRAMGLTAADVGSLSVLSSSVGGAFSTGFGDLDFFTARFRSRGQRLTGSTGGALAGIEARTGRNTGRCAGTLSSRFTESLD